jgi:hypothetical protein
VRSFFRHVQTSMCNILNIKLLPRKFLLLVDVRTIQETRFESFKLKPVDKKVLFLADFRSKTNF